MAVEPLAVSFVVARCGLAVESGLLSTVLGEANQSSQNVLFVGLRGSRSTFWETTTNNENVQDRYVAFYTTVRKPIGSL